MRDLATWISSNVFSSDHKFPRPELTRIKVTYWNLRSRLLRVRSLVAVVHLVVHGVDGERGLGRGRLAADVAHVRLVVGGGVPLDRRRLSDEGALRALDVFALGVHE